MQMRMRAPTHNVCVIFTGCFVLSPNHLAAKHGNKNGAFIIGQWTLKINSRNLWLIWTVGLACAFYDYLFVIISAIEGGVVSMDINIRYSSRVNQDSTSCLPMQFLYRTPTV